MIWEIGCMRPEEAKVFDDDAGYHKFVNEAGEQYGSFEVFWHEPHCNKGDDEPMDRPGWFWWATVSHCHSAALRSTGTCQSGSDLSVGSARFAQTGPDSSSTL